MQAAIEIDAFAELSISTSPIRVMIRMLSAT